jgi:hypothetical protein
MVTEVFDNLKELQNILVEKYDLEAKVAEAPKQLSSQDELLARLKKEYIAKNTEYDELKEKVGVLKVDLDEAVKSREAGEKGMDNITTHREYEALEKQIAEATDKENNVRKDLQREEKRLSELNENLKNYESMIASQESDLNASRQSLDNTISGYNSRISELQAEEDKISQNVDKEILFKFQRIIQRNSDGIVAVRNGVCTGCHMILPAQFANIVRVGDNINFCPYCSRILFYEEVAEDEAENYFDINSAGSLADLDDDFEDEGDDEDMESRDEELGDSYEEDDSDLSEDDEDEDFDDEADEESDEDDSEE